MTFADIVTEVMNRLNLSSATALARVGQYVNDRYRRLTSSIGLETSRRAQISAQAVIGDQTMIFGTVTGIEKILAVIDKTGTTNKVLNQVTVDDMHALPLQGTMPRHFAVSNMHPTTVDILVDCIPASTFTLYADVQISLATIAGADEPDFPESFHDTLIYAAMADEYRKMEKPSLMMDAEQNYERRLSDLRMWIAKTAYMDIYMSKSKNRYPWYKG